MAATRVGELENYSVGRTVAEKAEKMDAYMVAEMAEHSVDLKAVLWVH